MGNLLCKNSQHTYNSGQHTLHIHQLEDRMDNMNDIIFKLKAEYIKNIIIAKDLNDEEVKIAKDLNDKEVKLAKNLNDKEVKLAKNRNDKEVKLAKEFRDNELMLTASI